MWGRRGRGRSGIAWAYWVLFKLIWRDYLRFHSANYRNSIFLLGYHIPVVALCTDLQVDHFGVVSSSWLQGTPEGTYVHMVLGNDDRYHSHVAVYRSQRAGPILCVCFVSMDMELPHQSTVGLELLLTVDHVQGGKNNRVCFFPGRHCSMEEA